MLRELLELEGADIGVRGRVHQRYANNLCITCRKQALKGFVRALKNVCCAVRDMF